MKLVVVVALAGCGRLAFDERADASSATGTPCTEPWSAPALVDLGGNFEAPSLRGDGLELYVVSTGEMYVATRATRSESFGAPAVLPSPPNSPDSDVSIHMSDDGLELAVSVYVMGTSP